MPKTLDYLAEKFKLDYSQPSPIPIPIAERPVMAQLLAELGFHTGVEVGVLAGVHAEQLCQSNPGVTLYCVDPWKLTGDYHEYHQANLNAARQEAVKRLAPYHAVIMQMTSLEAVTSFPEYSLDFVYLDAAHDFMHIAEDICVWIRRIRPGGILFGHDFWNRIGHGNNCHVESVVRAYAESHELRPWFVLGNGGYKPRSHFLLKEWMFVQEGE